MREPSRQTEFVFVSPVIISVERAADRAAVRAVIANSLHDFICRVMRLETRKVLLFHCWVAVERFHGFSFG
jgi:hypothetical protein